MRAVVFLAPIVVSVGGTAVTSRALPPAPNLAVLALWWLGISAVATALLWVTDRLARRLLPLTALLNLSLVFPDRAPSRFRTALRTGTVRQLEARIEEIRRDGIGDDPVLVAETLVELLAALNHHDRLTRGHAERVRAYCRMIGEELRLTPDDLDRLHWAGLAHDVGKLLVPAEILNKPGKLTDDEFRVIKTHPSAGAQLIAPLAGWLGEWSRSVAEHHEKWDGSGYPKGLAGEQISLGARIVAVADVFDVITSVRSYKAASSPVEARDELVRCAGSHFDPAVVRAFVSISLGRLRLAMGPLSSLANLPVVGRLPMSPAIGAVASAATAATAAVALFFGGILDAPGLDATPTTEVAAEDDGVTVPTQASDPVVHASTTRNDEAEDEGPSAPTTTVVLPPTLMDLIDRSATVRPRPQPPEPTATVDPGTPIGPPNPTEPAPTGEEPTPERPAPTPTTTPPTAVPAPTTTPPTTTAPPTTAPPLTAPPTTAAPTTTAAPPTTTTPPPTTTTAPSTTTTTESPTTTTTVPAPVNQAPVALADAYGTDEDTTLVVGAAQGLLANDTDEDGDALQVETTPVDPPDRGVLALGTDGSFAYAPDADANGADTFRYRACDGEGECAEATVSVQVAAVDDAPVAVDDVYELTVADTLVVPAPGVLANDDDEDSALPPATLRSPPAAGAGTVTVAADGSFTYVRPDPAWSGVVTFTYAIGSGVGQVTIDVAPPPLTTYRLFMRPTGGVAATSLLSETSPAVVAGAEPDHPGDPDTDPGFTIRTSDQLLTNTNPTMYQHWTRQVGAGGLELRGPVSLDLWSAAAGFGQGLPVDWSAWLHDCDATLSSCDLLASQVDVHLDAWSSGPGWVRRTLDLGFVERTLAPGRVLRLRLMFGHEDVWIAMTGDRATQLLLTVPTSPTPP